MERLVLRNPDPAHSGLTPQPATSHSLLTRLAAIIATVLVVVFGVYAVALSSSSIQLLQRQAQDSFVAQTVTLRDVVAQLDDALTQEASRFMRTLEATVPGPYSLDSQTVEVAGQATPRLRSGDTVLNANVALPDHFFDITGGAIATLFARTGDDFIRVTTSLKKQDGSRAVATLLDRKHPAYAALMKGEAQRGLAWLFGKPYASMYQPVRDAAGQIVGALYVGVDVSSEMTTLQARIRDKHLSAHDQFMVIDATPGPDQGKIIASPARQGDIILDEEDGDGLAWVRHMLDTRDGVMVHPVARAGDGHMAEQLTAYASYPGWHWIIVGSVPVDSLNAALIARRNLFLAAGLLIALALAGGFWWLLRHKIGRPLAQATAMASHIAAGDLSMRLETDRRDEFGALMQAINGIGTGLSRIVATVRQGATAIGGGTNEIAQGNADLSQRTAQQASTLESTVSSLEELSATTAQNAASARTANQAAHSAATAAREGGATIARVVDTMAGIQNDAAQIVNIISLIDGIAFQTNILALNAAVESARAGEHGRGFAVVAGEVRTLAQRSAAAAADIKTLIQHTVDNVRDGNDAVTHAGKAIEDIIARVERVATEMDSIATASHEQSLGIAQAQSAAHDIDQVTQQNAALVTQAAAAASSLNEQARDLQQAVQAFRLAD